MWRPFDAILCVKDQGGMSNMPLASSIFPFCKIKGFKDEEGFLRIKSAQRKRGRLYMSLSLKSNKE